MHEQFCRIGELDLCYETFGSPTDPPILLIMGLGTQMVGWHEQFCEQLAGRGFFVIRFDNRDVGRSGRARGRPPGMRELLLRRVSRPAYTLTDMAEDAAGLLECLEIQSAHVVGASMGGMIAQTLAARHPERVRSLTSIMSTTGGRFVGQVSVSLYPVVLRRPPRDRDAYVERTVKVFNALGTSDFPREDDDIREMAALSYDRGHDAAGAGRQLAAIVASGDRTSELRSITAPTLVLHGTRDRMVRPSGARATAKAIPGARLEWLEGMGHDLPRQVWPRILDAIERHARAAEDARGAEPAAA
jgi:pimeloyl-ACP methyl ester carboxylesterase